MSDAAIATFSSYFGKPIFLATIFIILLFALLVMCIIKITRNGIEESQFNEKIDHIDVFKYVLRALIVMFIMAAFLGL